VAPVEVRVAAKAGSRYLGVIDVNGGTYEGHVSTSSTGSGALTDLPVGSYEGSVRLAGDRLTLTVREQTIPLNGPLNCD
jgi:hypothetical protein